MLEVSNRKRKAPGKPGVFIWLKMEYNCSKLLEVFMREIFEDVKKYYRLKVLIVEAACFFLCVIFLVFSDEGAEIGGLLLSGIFLFLLPCIPVCFYIMDRKIIKWQQLSFTRMICKVYWENEQKKYDSLIFLLNKYKTSELKATRLKLKVDKETKAKFGITNILPILLSCIAIYIGLASEFAVEQNYRAMSGYILLFIFCIVGYFILLPNEYKNTDDYILFCIEEILENKNQ
jgi:hypothetical protein